MIHYGEILRASLERINEELAANGRSVQDDLGVARRELIKLVYEFCGPFDLMSAEGDILRKATLDETIESCLAGDTGLFEVDGECCYVQP